MGDEDRTEQQLPQRVKGVAETRSAPSAWSPMSSELRQRMQAAVNAERARVAGIDTPAHHLADNNAYEFFSALGDLIRTGPTNTNVGDIQVILVG